jgi:hypothetical protein
MNPRRRSMCPECVLVIAVAIAAATPPMDVKAFLERTFERLAKPGKTLQREAKESIRYGHQPD